MPRGSKAAYTDKQKRQAEHIEESYEEKGVSTKEAERRAWATVNKEWGGGLKKSGSGTKKKSASRDGRKKKTSATKGSERKAASRKGSGTRATSRKSRSGTKRKSGRKKSS